MTDDLNHELDRAVLESVRDLFNQPVQPGNYVHQILVELAKSVIMSGPFNMTEKSKVLDLEPHRHWQLPPRDRERLHKLRGTCPTCKQPLPPDRAAE